MPGNWDLSKFTPMILLPGLLWLLGPFEIDFKNSSLGAMFSFSSGSGVRMRDGKLKGYDCFVSGTEKDYQSYMTSEAFIWEEYGAQPALESGWIKEFDVENCDFEWTPIRVLTGGKGSNPFLPGRANPGIEKVRVKNCTSQAGFDIAAIRYGDCSFENVSLSVNMTIDRMNAFYKEFPNRKWPGDIGIGTTGSPIQSGFRYGIRVGRQNVPPEGGSDLYYMDTNGKVEIKKLRVPYFVTDVVPWPAKYDGKNNFNAVDVRATKNCVMDDIEISNHMDLAFWRDSAYAAYAPLDCEPLYGKCVVTLTNAKITNFGPCEGPFAFKPAYDGSTVSDIVVGRDMGKVPTWLHAVLTNMPEAKDRFGTIYTAPNEVPNRQRALLSIADSPNNTIENITEEPFEMPPGGDDHLVAIYNGRMQPKNTVVKDANGQVIYRR